MMYWYEIRTKSGVLLNTICELKKLPKWQEKSYKLVQSHKYGVEVDIKYIGRM